MSRSLLGFLLFCLLLVLTGAGLVWYVGPTAAGILFDSERRESPYYVLQLLPEAALPSRVQEASYRSAFLSLADADEGRLVWQGGGAEVVEGPVLLNVASVQLVSFPTGGDLVQMLTGTAYRALESRARDMGVHLLGSSMEPERLASDAASVVVLYRHDEAAPVAPLGAPGESGWLAKVPRFGGEVRWRASLSTIRGEGEWTRVLMVQFPSVTEARGWLEDPITVTERAIAGKHVDDMVVVLVEPAGYALR